MKNVLQDIHFSGPPMDRQSSGPSQVVTMAAWQAMQSHMGKHQVSQEIEGAKGQRLLRFPQEGKNGQIRVGKLRCRIE